MLIQVNNPLMRASDITYLTENQLNALTEAFRDYYDEDIKRARRINRGRYWLVYLVLRFTGARLGEVLSIDDKTDIDFRNYEIKLITLKQKTTSNKKNKYKTPSRIVPVPANVIAEIANYIATYPHMRGKIFKLDQGNFRRKFYELGYNAGIPKPLAHPHILRHSRAIELLKAGVPITIVQNLLGHAYLTTTAIYLQITNSDAKYILKERGLI